MGQARQRGAKEERVKLAVEKRNQEMISQIKLREMTMLWQPSPKHIRILAAIATGLAAIATGLGLTDTLERRG